MKTVKVLRELDIIIHLHIH